MPLNCLNLFGLQDMNTAFPEPEAEEFSHILASLLSEDQARSAQAGIEQFRKGGLPQFHFEWGVPVRNYTRHYGYGFNPELLENEWWRLLQRAAEIRLSPEFTPLEIKTERTSPLPEEREGGVSWIARMPAAIDPEGRHIRIFEFYKSGWYEEVWVDRDSDEMFILQCGRYTSFETAKVAGISLFTSEYQSEPLPPGGEPYDLILDPDTSNFSFADFIFTPYEGGPLFPE